MKSAEWTNTTVLTGDLANEAKALKAAPGPDMVILSSASIVSQLSEAHLLDGLQLVVNPIAFGDGRKLLAGVNKILAWRLVRTCAFGNGAVFLDYAPA